MVRIYKTLSVLFFIGTPASFVASIWYSNWRFFFISIVLFMFSSLAASMAVTYEKNQKKSETLEDLFKMLDQKTLDKMEE